MPDVPLAKAISSLRAELQEAMEEGKDEDLRFGLGNIQVELQVKIDAKVGAEGKAGFWSVFSVAATAEGSRASTHTLKLTLIPRLSTNLEAEVLVTDKVSERPDGNEVTEPPNGEDVSERPD